MTTVQILLAIAIIALFAIMIIPTIMAMGGSQQAFAFRMIAAVVLGSTLWVADTLHAFPSGTYQAGLWILAPALAYFAGQHYMDSVYEKETCAGGAPLPTISKLGQLFRSIGQVLACAAAALAAAYLPAQVYLFLWEKIDGTAAGVVGVLFWIFGVHVVWMAEAGVVGVLWAFWHKASRFLRPASRAQSH